MIVFQEKVVAAGVCVYMVDKWNEVMLRVW